MIRSRLVPVALVALALACGGDLPAAFLHIEALPGTPAPDTIELRFLAADGADLFHYESIPLGGLDLTVERYTVRVEADGDSPFAKPVLVAVTGLATEVPVASWTGTIDLARRAEQTIVLAPLPAGCDRDRDGFKDCSTSGCCTESEAAFADCDDDSALEQPLSSDLRCRACADSDGDAVSDCRELAHEPPCDPDEAASAPDAPEVCDSRDNDCDGQTDEGQFLRDWDGLVRELGESCGTGACAGGTVGCLEGEAACSTASLTSAEATDDGVDNDCNGATDEGGALDDTDGDGVPDADEASACTVPHAELRAEVHPGAAEPCCPTAAGRAGGAMAVCDLDCDGTIEACGVDDTDGDGFGAPIECDDGDAAVYPGAPERCGDGVDQDCDGSDTPCTAALDEDGDGYLKAVDCNDHDADAHPGAAERCNGLDDDCDGLADEGNPEATEPGGAPSPCGLSEGECVEGLSACHHAPGSNPLVLCLGNTPPATETCNDHDDDCDGATDEGLDPAAGGCLATGVCAGHDIAACEQGAWTCPYADALGATYESPETTCDALDNDCDGATDEDLEGPALSTCKKLGECLAHVDEILALCQEGTWNCTYPFASHQELEDRCDGLDNDCDGATDEGLALVDWDDAIVPLGAVCGTGLCAGGFAACAEAGGGVICSTATNALSEACNGTDDDCDGDTDEGFAWGGQPLAEACDGVGACGLGLVECLPDGFGATCSTNADGSEPDVAIEACNLADDDCDGLTDEELGAAAADAPCLRQGVCTVFNVVATCDDGDWTCDYAMIATYEPGAETLCDGKDNDCDGEVDEDLRYVDPSGTGLWLGAACDGTGECGGGTVQCGLGKAITCSTNPDGDAPDAVPETCNGLDDDCDGDSDEPFTWNSLPIGAACNGVGECADGLVECASATLATCSSNPDGSAPGVALEVCNLLDDDCDGLTDEHLDAAAADATCRFLGVCTRLNVIATCIDGDWACDYGNLPAYDDGVEARCDGLDNDCDGLTDEDFSWTDPVSGLSSKKGAPCGSGACLGGVVVCTPGGSGLACSTDVAVDFEVCDHLDNDCDGATDEGLRYTDPTSGEALSLGDACDGVGACGAGVVECSADKAITCSTNADGSTREDDLDACDGLDNDCDGLTDEELTWQGIALGEACDGTGECGIGVVVCAVDAAVTTCTTNPDGPDAADGPEACNGLDDDCDGAEDDGLTVDDSPCRTTGACLHPLVNATCSGAGAWLCDYSAVPGWRSGDEVGKCDTIDNDCDGLTDEDFPALDQPCDGGDDDACAYGVGVCTANGSGVTCDDQSPAVEACDGDPSTGLGVDEDCDGLTDEPGALDCEPTFLDLDGDGFGRTGESRCQCGPDAVSHYTAAVDGDCDDSAQGASVNPGADEACNGLDDDCDGQTDALDPELAAHDSPACLLQSGVCAGSTRPPELCQGGAWAACTDATYRAAAATYEHGLEASCDGLDNDCDGATDDDFTLTLPDGAVATRVGDACGVGACAGGTLTCNAAGDGLSCPSIGNSSLELCGGGDDDCDGLVDALDPDLGANDHPPCEVQQGVCHGATKPAGLCEAGTWKACDAAAYAAHATTFQAATETACDGLDNDCSGGTDEDFSLVLPNGATVTSVGVACGVGACAGGTTICRADEAGLTCTSLTLLAPEVCGGGDNDCDGLTDAVDPSLATNDAPACERTAGVCAGTTKPPAFCVNGGWLPCPDTFYLAHDTRYEATEVTCEGVDNDCDGATDDDFQVTTPEGSTHAGVGKPCGTGECAGGVTLCTSDHAGITCSSLVEALPETCNAQDDDCDGKIDAADPDLQRPLCANQHGVCSGSLPAPARCSGGYWAACSVVDYTNHSLVYKSGPEAAAQACDGFDNNCNNETDEGYVSTPTTCGKGACARTGARICTGGAVVDTCVAGTPAANDATCNKIDDDCDDSTDEEFPAGPSTCGTGACARTGTRSCTNGVPGDTCAPGSPTNETCNGVDDDCDGKTDAADTDDLAEGYLRHDHPACAEQDGVCAGAEKTAALCYAGAWHECDAAALLTHADTYEAVTEATCDGLDNDCDANVDEDFSLLMPDGARVEGVGEDCGFGACAGGTTLCNDDHDGLECTTLANLGDEVCGDGDEDCDGRTDEYLGAWSTADAVATKAGGTLSAAVAANGTLYAAFHYDPSGAKDLYLAENPGSGWTTTPIVTDHTAGAYSALVVDGAGNLHVVYSHDEPATKELRVVSRVGGTWSAPVTIDGSSSAKITVGNVSADVDATDALHVAYYVSDGDKKDLRYATDFSGAWVVEEVEPGNALDVGKYASLRIASTGWPRIGYADLTSALVKYAERNGAGWTVENVTGVSSSTSYSVSLALDADDLPYLGFYDGFDSAVRVATRAGAGWTSRVVEGSISVGTYGTSLSVDEAGGLHVAYHVISSLNDLHYASAPSFAGAWSPVVLDETGATGRYPALLRTPQGRLHVVHQTSTGALRHSKRTCP